MKADFSRYPEHQAADRGLYLQQGRVLLDSDWNAQAAIQDQQREFVARDSFGQDQAAVPAHLPGSGKLVSAQFVDQKILLELQPGRLWLNGQNLPLGQPEGTDNFQRQASYLEEALQIQAAGPENLAPDMRDAVVIESWAEVVSAFQEPQQLLEPALGGPDTCVRLRNAVAFRLLRLAPEDNCATANQRLIQLAHKEIAGKGQLSVNLQPTELIEGDCPLELKGGYSGLEHRNFRLEISRIAQQKARLKWSSLGGGLGARATYLSASKQLQISDNWPAIQALGRQSFYLEALAYDAELGHYTSFFAASAQLGADQSLLLDNTTGSAPQDGQNLFIRLWDGIVELASFPKDGQGSELSDGLLLQIDPDTGSNYRDGDFWSFSLRVGQQSQQILFQAPPRGPRIDRALLAIIQWPADFRALFQLGQIQDCRKIFRPLTSSNGCCSLQIGDGLTSHGDFDSLDQALQHLPPEGGNLCLLPGVHRAGVSIQDRKNIQIHGCGVHSLLIPSESNHLAPLLSLSNCQGIQIKTLRMVHFRGTCILLEGDNTDICILDNQIIAAENGIRALNGRDLLIKNNRILAIDIQGAGACLSIRAQASRICDNQLGVLPDEQEPPSPPEIEPPSDPCADTDRYYINAKFIQKWVHSAFVNQGNWFKWLPLYAKPYFARGGIELGAGSRDLSLVDNLILGGSGIGIALGTLDDVKQVRSEEDSHSLTIPGPYKAIKLQFLEKGVGKAGHQIRYQSKTRSSEKVTRSASKFEPAGFHHLEASADDVRLQVQTPGYILSKPLGGNPDSGADFRFEIKPLNKAGHPRALYDLKLEGNRIFKMGGAGIGTTPLSAFLPLLSLEESEPDVTGAVNRRANQPPVPTPGASDLEWLTLCELLIERNEIRDNLVEFTETSGIGKPYGQGGICLGLGEDILIRDNRIEDNGISQVQAVCGIYAQLVERIWLVGNRVFNNSRYRREFSAGLLVGPRAALHLHAVNFPLLDAAGEPSSDSNAAFAARIQDNLFDQPVGPALFLEAMGEVSVQNNRFVSHFADPALGSYIGAVYLSNHASEIEPSQRFTEGASNSSTNNPSASLNRALGEATHLDATLSESAHDSSGASLGGGNASAFGSSFLGDAKSSGVKLGDNNPTIHLNWSNLKFGAATRFIPRLVLSRRFPSGITLFSGNQVLQNQEHDGKTALIAVVESDLGFHGNQLRQANQGQWNSLLWATDLIADCNRLRDSGPTQRGAASLLGIASSANITTLNQGERCIFGLLLTETEDRNKLIQDSNQVRKAVGCNRALFLEGWTAPSRRLFRGTSSIKKLVQTQQETDPNPLVDQLVQLRRKGLQRLLAGQMSAARHYGLEKLRLSAEVGANHPASQQSMNRSASKNFIAADLASEFEIASLNPAEMDGNLTLLHGRAVDSQNFGIPGLAIWLETEAGMVLSSVGQAFSDELGYYSFSFDQKLYNQLLEITHGRVILVAGKSQKEEIYRHPKSTQLIQFEEQLVDLFLT